MQKQKCNHLQCENLKQGKHLVSALLFGGKQLEVIEGFERTRGDAGGQCLLP